MSYVIRTNNDRLLLLPPLTQSKEVTVPPTPLSADFWERLNAIAQRPVKDLHSNSQFSTVLAPRLSPEPKKKKQERKEGERKRREGEGRRGEKEREREKEEKKEKTTIGGGGWRPAE